MEGTGKTQGGTNLVFLMGKRRIGPTGTVSVVGLSR